MLILVEGVDKAGKSTFIQGLVSEFGLPVYKKSVPAEIAPAGNHEYFKGIGYAILGLHNCLNFSIIIDRSFISDFVYSSRRNKQLDFDVWRAWERASVRSNVLLVYVSIDRATQATRLNRVPDAFTDVSDYEGDIGSYDRYLAETRFCVAQIDGRMPFTSQVLELRKAVWQLPQFVGDSFAERLTAHK